MKRTIKKNSLMYTAILLTWLFCIMHFNPKLFSILSLEDSIAAKLIFVIFVLLLNLFWLYGIYHCVFLLFRIITKRPDSIHRIVDYPGVAILYTTRNDFQENAVLSCCEQNYPDFHVFILDDSTDEGYKARIDRFHDFHPERLTVVRRKDRKGFKAGNLNNALRYHAMGYDYFAVIDADEVIPSDFLKKLIPYFGRDENIGFVQANHEQHPDQPSKFAEDLALGINFHWNIYQLPRNDYGFTVFYGHGGVIRRDVWEKVGGFPEIVSEDLAFSTRIRQHGYIGYFVREVTCYEHFPETYQQFRGRYEKWVKGACEYLHKEFLPFLLSKRITTPEKLDVLFACFSLFIPALFLIFIFIANAVLPMLLVEKHILTISLFDKNYELMPVYFMEPRFEHLWTYDFYLITLLGMFAPVFCYIGKIFSNPGKLTRLIFKSAVPYIALILVSACGIITYLVTRKAVFLTTGDKAAFRGITKKTDSRGFMDRLTSNHPMVFHLEWLTGALLVFFAIKTVNIALLTIAACLILSPLIARYGWEKKALSYLVFLPLFFVLLAFGGMGLGFLGMQGISLCFISLHF